jgi:hypothetical protein
MIKEQFIEIKGHRTNFDYFVKLGYPIQYKRPILVKVVDLMSGSTCAITSVCDNCNKEKKTAFRDYYEYTYGLKEKYYCNKCNSIKRKETCIEKYGVDNPMQVDDIKNKLKDSLLDKYGVNHYSKTDEYKEKYKETCIEKYGVDNASKYQDVKELISDIKLKYHNSLDKYKELISDEYDIIEYNKDRNFTISHKRCSSNFDIFIVTLSDRIKNKNIICTNCNPIDNFNSSSEIELKLFLKDCGVDFIENSYKIIPPLSLDIFIPDLNLAIEFNGVYWHSEIYKDKKYHYNKTISCNKLGIELIHIWEDDWNNKQEIVKSILVNKIKKSKSIYARNCILKEVEDVKLIKNFLDKNHIQGYVNSSIKIGLFYKDELVSLMCFGKKKKNMELVRFCNILGFNIVGAASKLFKYFIKNYNFNYIESFSDNAMFNGNLYTNLGFKFVYNTPINYWWVVGSIRKHRFNFNKKTLVKNGFDENKSESEIMNERGYYRIWGCGLKKWVYLK